MTNKLNLKIGDLLYALEAYEDNPRYFIEAHRYLAEVNVEGMTDSFVIAIPVSWSTDPVGLTAELYRQAARTLNSDELDLMVIPRPACYENLAEAKKDGEAWLADCKNQRHTLLHDPASQGN